MASIAAELKAQIEKIEEEMDRARQKLKEASEHLPKLYRAVFMLDNNENDTYYIPLYGHGASRNDRIMRLLSESEYPLRPIEIAKALNDDAKAIRSTLVYAKRRGLIDDYNGRYYILGTFNPENTESNNILEQEAA